MRMWARTVLALLSAACVAHSKITDAAEADVVRSSPQRVLSLSLCTDDLVMELLPDTRIAGVTWLAADPRYGRLAERARRLNTHHARIEQVLALKPDRILGLSWEVGSITRMLKTLGVPVVALKPVESLEDIPRFTRELAAAVGEDSRAEILLAEYDKALRALAADSGKLRFKRVLSLAPNAYTQGLASLQNAVLKRIGAGTVADVLQWQQDGVLSLERLVTAEPDLFLLGTKESNTDALAHRILAHPALQILRTQVPAVEWDSRALLCPGPHLAASMKQLQTQLVQLSSRREVRAP